MKKLILVFLLVFASSTCLAGFGGARSSGGFSSSRSSFSSGSRSSSFGGSRSSFGGARSYSVPMMKSGTFGGNRSSMSGPATISKPALRIQEPIFHSAPVYSAPVIVHHHDSGFWNWMMFDTLFHPRSQVVVVPGGQSVMESPVIVESQHSFFYYLMWSAVIVFCLWLVWRLWKESEEA